MIIIPIMRTTKSAISLFLLMVFQAILLSTDARLIIKSPSELVAIVKQKHPDGIPYSVANYGDVPFGKTLGGTIYLPPSVLENCIYEPLQANHQRKVNKLVMSTRGDCTFTTKSLNAQRQGAKMAIIADNVDTEEPGRVVLVDDGRGPQVKIPTIFIDHELGELIHQFTLDKNATVSIVVSFQTHHRPKADVTVWLSSYDRSSYVLVRQLKPYFQRIPQYIQLSVRHPTSACKSCPETDCYGGNHYCINTGFYGYFIEGYGQWVIDQQLKEQIILKHWPEKWWEYMDEYDEECDDKFSMMECSEKSMRNVGIDSGKVQKILKSSFSEATVTDKESGQNKTIIQNSMLEDNRKMKYKSGIIIYPGVIVNNITYRGNLEAIDVFELVCNSLRDQPEGCTFSTIEPETPWRYIFFVTIIIVLFLVFLVGCYRRHVRRELSKNMNKDVNEIVNQYITMYETQRFQGSEPASSSQA